MNGKTEGQTDGRMLPSTLSPSFAVHNYMPMKGRFTIYQEIVSRPIEELANPHSSLTIMILPKFDFCIIKVFEKNCEGDDELGHSIIDNETFSCEIGFAV